MSDETNPPAADIAPISIEDEMRGAYLDYAMSVIVSRALPDVRDGFKPVHRRILYAMKTGGYDSAKPYRKSARIVGDVMGQFHPHSDVAIYDALVRMAQDFSMSLPLIDGQGNFGSMDGDKPAAMRYTEARLAKAAEYLLDDIDKETVDFQPNYDESTREPVVLPARFPNLLVNGAGGIAVGMATNIPPHNLGEVLDACMAMVDEPDMPVEALLEHIPGPDFPTGGEILGRAGILKAASTGHGSIVMRGACAIETIRKDTEAIIVTEIPYQVNKLRLIERMAEVAKSGQVEGVRDLRDESDRDGVRIVVELKRDANAEVVLNQLYRYTPLQTNFGCNMLALDQGRPRMLTLKDILSAFVAFREEVITRRTVHELGQARDRAHILVGLGVAVANIDEIIAIIRKAPDPATARAELIGRRWPAGEVAAMIRLIDEPGAPLGTDDSYQLSEAQARAILDLRLHRLTALERDKIAGELQEITDRIQEYLLILSSRAKRLEVLKGELAEMRERFAVPRRTAITEGEFEEDMEALIQREEMVVTVTHSGYIKRVPLSTYRAQRRGGKGRAGMSMKDQDFVTRLFVTSTHTPVLFFSSRGLAYMMKVYRLPQGSPQSRGKALVNLLPLSEDETITAILPLPEDEGVWEQHNILFVTSTGKVRRNKLSDFRNIRANGLIAMKLDESEHLVSVRLAQPDDTLLLTSAQGKGIRFPVDDIRVFSGRTSTGVRGIRLAPGDEVVAMSVLAHVATVSEERQAYLRRAAAERRGETSPGEADGLDEARYRDLAAAEEFILTVADTGMGKVTSAYEYRISGRGGQGIQAMDMSARRVGRLVTSFPVTREDEIMLVTDHGQLIRIPVDDLRVMGRQTQGVRLFRIDDDERVVSVAWIPEEETPAGEVAPADAAPGPEAEPPPAVGGGESETGGGEASPES